MTAARAALALALAAGCVGEDRIEHGHALGWEGGPEYWRRWPHGPPADPAYFPIGVWAQDPANAAAWKAIGVNVFVELYQGPTDRQLNDLRAGGMSTVCRQNDLALGHPAKAAVLAWQQRDQPDNAQPLPEGGYGACIDPAEVQRSYDAMVARDGTRPVFLALGRGIAVDRWIGRGRECAGRVDMYPRYVRAGDILAFHVYPINSTDPEISGKLWLMATGVDRLRAWSDYRRAVWPIVEASAFEDPARKPTPAQIRAQVWMSLVHGAMGIIYFNHVFKPRFSDSGILDDPATKAAVATLNQQIRELAPVLNTPTLPNDGVARSSNPAVPVDVMLKRHGEATYLFAVAMRDGVTRATFSVPGLPATATAEVLGERRRLPVLDGSFQDEFGGYAVHLYRITAP